MNKSLYGWKGGVNCGNVSERNEEDYAIKITFENNGEITTRGCS